jgi:hypothetical protein
MYVSLLRPYKRNKKNAMEEITMSEYTPQGLITLSVTKVCAKFNHKHPLKSCLVCNLRQFPEYEENDSAR